MGIDGVLFYFEYVITNSDFRCKMVFIVGEKWYFSIQHMSSLLTDGRRLSNCVPLVCFLTV